MSFSVLLCPAGVHVVAYRRSRGGLHIERYSRELRPGLNTDETARVVADLLEADGARGRRISIAVSGFGSCHQILTLPRAARNVLQPIVVRELRRFYPDVFAQELSEPIVDFVELVPTDSRPSPQNDLLVAAMPRDLVSTVVSTLADRGMTVDHWTIAPRALQRLYDAFSDGETTAAALVVVPDWPLLGFFHQRELRLFSEPRSGPGTTFDAGAGAVIEHVERGSIFLRQQFRGAAVTRLYLAAGPEDDISSQQDLFETVLGVSVLPFGPANHPPGAFAALGAALDGASDDGLNLLPAELRPPSASVRWTRYLAVASAGVLLIAAGWWAWSARRAEASARQEVAAISHALSAQSSLLRTVRPIIEERQSHARRAALIDLLSRDRRRLPEVLWPLQAAASEVEIRKLQVVRQQGGWEVVVGITATAMSYEQATDAITAVAQQLGSELPENALTVSGIDLARLPTEALDGPDPAATPIAANAEMSFIVPDPKETVE
ncbi:MAG: pilus assembly protein PilM [Gemmatimonadetes bacterium]|nr:pilus assembly protein PilM [Gemmatimonadota bacterium]